MARAGQIIADRYRLEEQLGRGAMGRIWRAQHLGLNSGVALKFLDPTIADNPDTFNRFMLEAQAAAAVRSAHVVQIFDFGVDDSVPYIAMELLQGEGLDKRLRARARLGVEELDKVMREVAEAVDNAHALGVIHRDLKPANIFVASEREREIVKVLDFGVAKLLRPSFELDSAALTSTGVLLGTPHYMSPEQARGSRSVDHRTDLWALAVIGYECLTGQLPFQGGSMGDILVQICTEEAPPPSELADVPPGFDEWFARGTQKQPSQRFASAGEMAEALSDVLGAAPAPTSRAREPRGSAHSQPATLRSDPGTRDETPRSSEPVVCAAPPVEPRASARWLRKAAPAMALACCALAIALWPEPARVSPRYGSVAAQSTALGLSPVAAPALVAEHTSAPPPAEAPPIEPAVAEPPPAPPAPPEPARTRPSRERGPHGNAQRHDAQRHDTATAAPERPPAPPIPPQPPQLKPRAVAPESDDLDPFSERR